MEYTTTKKVAYYNCDANRNMKVSAALREMQQAGTDHLSDLGLAYEMLYDENMVFLLSKTIANVTKMPVADQVINISTTPGKPIGARFTREAVISDEDMNPLVHILTLWVLVEPESRKIIRPAKFPYELPLNKSLVEGHANDEKFVKLEGTEPYITKNIDVGYSIIDNNGHVNNSSYLDLVTDLMPYDELLLKGIDHVMISYKNEAKFGDTVEISGYHTDKNRYNFIGTKHNGECFEAQILLKK